VPIKNDNSPVSFPVLHPYGHVLYQAGRGDPPSLVCGGPGLSGQFLMSEITDDPTCMITLRN
jgi:hypothetical protein